MARRTMRSAALVAAGLTILGLGLGACTPASQDHADPPSAASDTPPDSRSSPVRMAAVGDSITAGDSPDFAGGVPGSQSWVSHALGPEIEFVGGWAEWGASTELMATAVREPIDADVLVLLGGTNDLGWTSHADTAENLSLVAERAGVEAVVVSSIPPLDLFQNAGTEALNAFLEDYAEHRGWTWVDGAAGLRDDGRFSPGMSYDGVHLTEQGAAVLGEAIAAAVLEASGS